MKYPSSDADSKPAAPPAIKRRGMLWGSGVAAAAGVVAAVASRTMPAGSPEPAALAKQDTAAEGYRLSPHVQRYYETARV